MNWLFLIAGIVAAIGALIHAFLGERTDIKSLLASSVPPNEKVELRGLWHGFSAILTLTAVALFLLSLTDLIENPRTVAHLIAVTYAAVSLAFLAVVLRAGTSMLARVPQWVLLLAIAVLAWWGAA